MTETINRKLWIPKDTDQDTPENVAPHAETHESGGSDEINVDELNGVLKEPQKPNQKRVLRLISIRI